VIDGWITSWCSSDDDEAVLSLTIVRSDRARTSMEKLDGGWEFPLSRRCDSPFKRERQYLWTIEVGHDEENAAGGLPLFCCSADGLHCLDHYKARHLASASHHKEAMQDARRKLLAYWWDVQGKSTMPEWIGKRANWVFFRQQDTRRVKGSG
jgi:hypothetical protein